MHNISHAMTILHDISRAMTASHDILRATLCVPEFPVKSVPRDFYGRKTRRVFFCCSREQKKGFARSASAAITANNSLLPRHHCSRVLPRFSCRGHRRPRRRFPRALDGGDPG